MKRGNRLVGNVMLVRERENLPVSEPIFWRETTRRALGKVHYLVRILVAIEIPTVLLCALASGFGYGGQVDELSMLAACLAGLATVALSVQSANTIVSERVQQTLEVLLTTPLSGQQIVLEKARALWRLQLVATVPLLTVFGVESWLEAGVSGQNRTDNWPAYVDDHLAVFVDWAARAHSFPCDRHRAARAGPMVRTSNPRLLRDLSTPDDGRTGRNHPVDEINPAALPDHRRSAQRVSGAEFVSVGPRHAVAGNPR